MFKRQKSNKANSTFILGMAVFMCILLIGGLAVDFTKASYIKQAYSTMAQNATQTALKEQNTIGGFRSTSVNAAIDEYMKQRNPADYNIPATSETAAFRQNTCVNTKQYPLIEIQFDHTRRVGTGSVSPIYTSTGGNHVNYLDEYDFKKEKYTVINMRITDVADNSFMGIFGNPCQEYTIEASSIVINADWNAT